MAVPFHFHFRVPKYLRVCLRLPFTFRLRSSASHNQSAFHEVIAAGLQGDARCSGIYATAFAMRMIIKILIAIMRNRSLVLCFGFKLKT